MPSKTRNGVEILHRRYIQGKPERLEALQREEEKASVALQIYDLRWERGLTQQALANLVGTTPSVISRLENADYEGHSLSTLRRIASALDADLRVILEPRSKSPEQRPELQRR